MSQDHNHLNHATWQKGKSDENLPIDPELQAAQRAHRERLRQLGHYPEITFTSKEQLIAEVLRSTVLDLLVKAQAEPKVSISLDEEGLRRVFQEEIGRIAEVKGVPVAPLRAVLEKLGAAQIAIEEIPAYLSAAADQLIELRGQLARLRNDRPELAVIREQALALIDRGDLDAARAALHRGREAARALHEEMSRDEAEFLADEARIDHLQLAYRIAAQKYAEAAVLVAPFDPAAEWQTLLRQASELENHGYEFGDNQAFIEAIGIYRRALTLAPRQARPLDWATTQNNLGNALRRLGERESGTTLLKEAVVAYRAALEETTRAHVPLDWATIQNNLGNALSTLGEHEGRTALLKEAVVAYRVALEERTRVHVPLDWAMTQNNLGTALRRLGERENGTALLKEAVAAYRAALQEVTPARGALQWAMTQDNLGNTLRTLGERGSGTVWLEEAVAAYQAALEKRTRARVPLQWAASTGNQGVALRVLAERRGDLPMAEQALAQITAAFETLRAADHVNAGYYEAQLSATQALVERLRKG